MAQAHDQERILVTLDKDFGELAIVYGKPHRGIIRIVDISARQQGFYCARVIETYEAELSRGALITVTQDRVRLRLGS